MAFIILRNIGKSTQQVQSQCCLKILQHISYFLYDLRLDYITVTIVNSPFENTISAIEPIIQF